MDTFVLVNPGSGGVDDSDETNAITNIKHFITDCNVSGINFVRIPESDYGDGRYAFLLWKDTRCHIIQMPGISLEKVRFIGKELNPYDFPRLYVDDSSYLWEFALLTEEDFKEPDYE